MATKKVQNPSKTNTYAFTIYEESNPLAQVWDFLTTNHFAGIISPEHDSDVWTEEGVRQWRDSQKRLHDVLITEDATEWAEPTGEMVRGQYGNMEPEVIKHHVPQVGEPKKSHRHVMLKFDYSVPVATILGKLAPLSIAWLEPVNSVRQYTRYMCHLDNPEKHRYDVTDVLTLGGLDISCLFEKSQPDRIALEHAIIDTLDSGKIHSITGLQKILMKKGQWLAYSEVKAKFGYWTAYMKGIPQGDKQQAMSEYEEMRTAFDDIDLVSGEIVVERPDGTLTKVMDALDAQAVAR